MAKRLSEARKEAEEKTRVIIEKLEKKISDIEHNRSVISNTPHVPLTSMKNYPNNLLQVRPRSESNLVQLSGGSGRGVGARIWINNKIQMHRKICFKLLVGIKTRWMPGYYRDIFCFPIFRRQVFFNNIKTLFMPFTANFHLWFLNPPVLSRHPNFCQIAFQGKIFLFYTYSTANFHNSSFKKTIIFFNIIFSRIWELILLQLNFTANLLLLGGKKSFEVRKWESFPFSILLQLPIIHKNRTRKWIIYVPYWNIFFDECILCAKKKMNFLVPLFWRFG